MLTFGYTTLFLLLFFPVKIQTLSKLSMPSVGVNRILQDVSFFSTYNRAPQYNDDYEHRISLHLRYVYDLLSKARVHHLTPLQQQNRKSNLLRLANYTVQGEYPQHNDIGFQACDVDQTLPRFRDYRGVMCAVGYLVATSFPGGEQVVDQVNKEHEYSYIEDMVKSPRIGSFLRNWATHNGFTLHDLAMIQPRYVVASCGRLWKSPLHGSYVTTKAAIEKVHYSCDDGYILIGDPDDSCTWYLYWHGSVTTPECRLMDAEEQKCLSLLRWEHASVMLFRDSQTGPITALYRCHSGFTQSSGKGSRCVGSTWTPLPPTGCHDINECRKNNFSCLLELSFTSISDKRALAAGTRCVNTQGSFRCVCPNGYRSTGKQYKYSYAPNSIFCVDINECQRKTATSLCPSPTHCVNTEGSYKCICPDGSQPTDNFTCSTICNGLPPLPAHAKVLLKYRNARRIYENGTKVPLYCKKGYSNFGSPDVLTFSVCMMGKWTETSLRCLPAPCRPACHRLGGKCMSNRCICRNGWSGHRCQKPPCTNNCVNGGVCLGPDACRCPVGFTGKTCEERSMK